MIRKHNNQFFYKQTDQHCFKKKKKRSSELFKSVKLEYLASISWSNQKFQKKFTFPVSNIINF